MPVRSTKIILGNSEVGEVSVLWPSQDRLHGGRGAGTEPMG